MSKKKGIFSSDVFIIPDNFHTINLKIVWKTIYNFHNMKRGGMLKKIILEKHLKYYGDRTRDALFFLEKKAIMTRIIVEEVIEWYAYKFI